MIRTLRSTRWVVGTISVLLLAGTVRAQNLSDEIVVSLPPDTVHVELIRLSKLRTLSSYTALRKQYTDSRLNDIDVSLARFGIQDTDIDEILLAWQPLPADDGASVDGSASPPLDLDKSGGWAQNRWPTLFGGLAEGRFNLHSIANEAKKERFPSISRDDSKIYCVSGGAAACMVLFQDSLGAFGSERSVKQIVDVRDGKQSNLVASPRFLSLLENIPPDPAIWGVAIDSGIADWFKSWPLAKGAMQLNWQEVLKSVETLQYSVTIGSDIELTVELDCKDSQTAIVLTQGFRGLRLVQAWMWQKQNPNQSNPLEALDIQSSDDKIVMTLTTTQDTIRNSNIFSSQSNGK